MAILKHCRFLPVVFAVAAAPFTSAAQEVSAECRGVAAGVVAAMRSAGELSGEDATTAAVIAARRACTAAREDLGPAVAGEAAASAAGGDVASASDEAKDDISLWDLLTGDNDRKPGNERLRRLKQ